MEVRSNNTAAEITSAKFERLMELGSGGMGRAHLAVSRGPQGFLKLVVLKSLKRELIGDDATYKMFLEEARISARLTHANLVQTYEVTELDGVPTIVLEYLEGQPLSVVAQALTDAGRVDIHLTILTHVLAGLHSAHELRDFDGTPLNLVHRDATPQNVIVQYDGQAKVLDFGIAKTTRSKVKTEIGIVKGKLRYMAPEQLVGDEIDRRVDVFSVGIMLWEAVTGRSFWNDSSDSAIMRRLLNGPIWQPSSELKVDEELADMARRALASEASDRYSSAGEFQRELTAYLAQRDRLCSAEQISRFMIERFATEREHTNQLVESHMSTLAESLRPASTRLGRTERPTRTMPAATAIAARHVKPGSVRRKQLIAIVSVGLVAIGLGFIGARLSRSHGQLRSKTTASALPGAGLVLECGSNAKSCNGQCVQFVQPEFGCNSATCFSCTISNATPRCNQRGECDIAVCYQAYDNCDGNAANGCETNVRIDPDHCGSCQNRCPELPHAQRGCGDVCTIWRCEVGYRDCNGDVGDGCEISVLTDAHNCGHCGAKCPMGSQCRNGRCA